MSTHKNCLLHVHILRVGPTSISVQKVLKSLSNWTVQINLISWMQFSTKSLRRYLPVIRTMTMHRQVALRWRVLITPIYDIVRSVWVSLNESRLDSGWRLMATISWFKNTVWSINDLLGSNLFGLNKKTSMDSETILLFITFVYLFI